MLSRHPERCRFPHGHTRKIEVVVAGDGLNDQGMLIDFKALKLALESYIDRYDHSMAVNSEDGLLPTLRELYPPDAFIVFEGQEPTTEVIAHDIYTFVSGVLREGFSHGSYQIPAGRVTVERIRVWETPTSWAEFEE